MEVKFFAAYRDVTGSRSETLPAQTDVLALLRLVAERWPDLRAQLLTAAIWERTPSSWSTAATSPICRA